MKPIVAALFASALLAGGSTASAQPVAAGDAAFLATTLSVSGSGEARVPPDMATISLGVTSVAVTASGALGLNAEQMQSVFAALRAAGIEERDIQTAGLNLNPQYQYEDQKPPRLTGYQADHAVTVTVHDLAALGATVDAVVASGANQVNGISFGLADDAAALEAARRDLLKGLQAKAEFYAAAVGLEVVRLVNLSEGVAPPSVPVTVAYRAELAQTTVAPGELAVRVDATAVYELAE